MKLKSQMRFVVLSVLLIVIGAANPAAGEFRAGAAAVDITPTEFPVLVNGGMLSRTASEVHTALHARAIVLDDGQTRLAIVVVDSCMLPRELLDEVKAMAAGTTGIPTENMLISATHAHSAPSCVGALGTDPDPRYPAFVKPRLARAIERAAKNLEPARVGVAVADAAPYTALRRWIRRPDRLLTDPFGNPTVRANMHPGYMSEDATGPSGPEDPDLSLIAFQSVRGRPIALLANFSMHYYSAAPISADYFGLFAERMKERIAPDESQSGHPPFVGILSHGTSGDIWLRDYAKPPPPKPPHDISSYTNALADIAQRAYKSIRYRKDVTLAMAQAELPLRYRTPDKQRLAWARSIMDAMGDRPPKNTTEVYAREAVLLHAKQRTKLILQALRIGEIGITAIPNEVYALTGLKLKAQSPLQPTVNIELANGAEGYIPPPEQHALGGYNTWPARSAGLEVQAEPKIVETVLELLEKAAGKPRRPAVATRGPAAKAIVDSRPVAYWRMDALCGPRAVDLLGGHDGIYETGVAFYLDGPRSDQFNRPGEVNRAAHFAGGRMRARIPALGKTYSVSMWFWNGMPNDGRPVTGYMFSRGWDHALGAPGDHLGLGGTQAYGGKLIFANGGEHNPVLGGRTVIGRWTWNHVVLVRDGLNVRVYLNGNPTPEIDGEAKPTSASAVDQLFVGGRNDNVANFEGRIDEVAVYDRALTPNDVIKLYPHADAEARGAKAAPGRFRAACVKVDITPDEPQWLHGYGPRQSEGVHDRIYHRIVALDDGRMQFFLVSTDICTVSPAFYDAFCRALEKQTGIKAEQVWWATTHTHAAPELGPSRLARLFADTLGDRYSHEPNTEYSAWVQERLIEGIKTARSQLEPARLGVGTGTSMANINRRGKTADGRSVLGVDPKGPVDRQIGLIRLERTDGTMLALVANYAIHGTVLGSHNRLISGDVCGIVSEYVERQLGAPMLFVNGAEGNVAPLYSVQADFKSSHITEFKALLGDRILDANRSIRTTTSEVTFTIGKTIVETPRKTGLGWPDSLSDYTRAADDGVKWVRIPVCFLKINKDTVLWAAPLELFCEIAMNVRRASPFPHTFYFGLTNGSLLYLPTRQAFAEGGYEPAVSVFTDRAEADFTRAVTAHLRRMARP